MFGLFADPTELKAAEEEAKAVVKIHEKRAGEMKEAFAAILDNNIQQMWSAAQIKNFFSNLW